MSITLDHPFTSFFHRMRGALAAACLVPALAFAQEPAVEKPVPPAPKTPPEKGMPTSGGTRVMKWKGGKDAVYMLAFDDGCPTHHTNVIPELEKRKIPGNFFVVTGNSLWKAQKSKWDAAVKSPYVLLQNHTFTHKGVLNVEEFEQELQKCNEVLFAMNPEWKAPRIIGFGRPGGVPWVITKEEQAATLAKYNLAERPPFYGIPAPFKSGYDMAVTVNNALAKGEMGHLDFHGVGGDWLTTPTEWFIVLLDKLVAERDRLWIADTAEWHKYLTERSSAKVEELQSDATQIRVKLTSAADPKLYDLPLTLASKVPAAWKSCTVTQSGKQQTVSVTDGEARYDALPGTDEVVIKPAQ